MSALSSTHRRAVPVPHIGGRTRRGRPDERQRLPGVGRRLATMALLLLLAGALLAAVPGLRDVLREIREIGVGSLALGVALELASAVSFVVVFRLFFDHLDGRDARALAWTAQGSGALLLGGGAVALMAGAPGPHDRLTVVLPTVGVAIGTLLMAALPAMLDSRTNVPRWIAAIASGVR